MQTVGVSPGFTAACAALGRFVCCVFEVSWDGTGLLDAARGGAGWSDESAYLISHTGQLRLNAPGDELVPPGDIGLLTVTLDNKDGRFYWQRDDSPLHVYIGGEAGMIGKHCRCWQGFLVAGVPEYVRIFTGSIESPKESPRSGTVALKVRDIGWEYGAQQRRSSVVSANQLASDWIATIATAAGIAAGDQVLDHGVYTIPFVWLDDEAVVQEIWEVASADGGRAYFDQLGKLRFESVLHWLQAEHLTPAWSFGEGDFQVLDPEYKSDDLCTKVIVEWSARAICPEASLYQLREMKTVEPGQTVIFEARFQNPAWSVIAPQATGTPIDYKVISAGGFDMAGSVTLALTNTYAQKTTVSITNNSASLAAYLIYLQIRGFPLVGGPSEQVEEPVAAPPVAFDRDRSVRGNPYLQTLIQADALAKFLAYRNARVRPTSKLANVPGIPQLELGDRVSFVERRALGAGIASEGYLIGIDWNYGKDQGFRQRLSILDAAGMYEYDDIFYVNVTALGEHGRCWF